MVPMQQAQPSDDANNVPSAAPNGQPVATNGQQLPAQQPSDQTIWQPASPAGGPISIGHPEAGPPARTDTQTKPAEASVQTVEHKPVLELKKEILPGVEEVHHHSEPISLPSQVQDAGVSSVPLPIGANTYIPPPQELPLTHQEVTDGLHKPIKKSIRWLAEWCVKQLKEAHLGAKRKLKGKR